MDDYQTILRRMAALQYKINSNDKKPNCFGTSALLYQSEIHCIDAIGMDGESNASQLSARLNISNGAVTQVTNKLLKKKLIEKYQKAANHKEVYFRLNEEGRLAYESHRQFHQAFYDKVVAYLQSLTPEQIEGILGYIAVADDNLPDLSASDQSVKP